MKNCFEDIMHEICGVLLWTQYDESRVGILPTSMTFSLYDGGKRQAPGFSMGILYVTEEAEQLQSAQIRLIK